MCHMFVAHDVCFHQIKVPTEVGHCPVESVNWSHSVTLDVWARQIEKECRVLTCPTDS